jgi:hypothetical protein
MSKFLSKRYLIATISLHMVGTLGSLAIDPDPAESIKEEPMVDFDQ